MRSPFSKIVYKLNSFSLGFLDSAVASFKAFASSTVSSFSYISSILAALFGYVYSWFTKNFEYSFYISGHAISRLFPKNNTFATYENHTLDALFLAISLHVLYAFGFLGNSALVFSNEGIWLLSLTFAVLFLNKYYQIFLSNQKTALEDQIDNIVKLCTVNSELALELSNLEEDLISDQIFTLALLEDFYHYIVTAFNSFDSELASSFEFVFDASLNKLFVSHFNYLNSIYSTFENTLFVSELNDLSEELGLESFALDVQA